MTVDAWAPEETFQRLAEMARVKTYFFSDIWRRSREEFGYAWLVEVVDNVTRMFGPEENGGWEAVITGYADFALDAMRNQKFFEANGRYRWRTLEEIQHKYYNSKDHMMRNYLPGMYLSHYLWPHHFKLLTFFRTQVLTSLVPSPSIFFDVGIGTGLYSREVLRAFPGVRSRGYDISPYAVEFTSNLLRCFGVEDRYEVVLDNIFAAELPSEKADFLVSQEVLEHLEQPEVFSRILYSLTKPGGKAYFTAAVNAGHSDHIYLFRSPQEVQDMLVGVGWKILKHHAEYAYEGMPLELTPCVAGFLCGR